MDNYKRKSLNFSKTCDNRELRAYRRSEDRRNIKHARLSALRGIDDNVIDTSVIEEDTKKEENVIRKVEKAVVNQRAEMLKKWKEEKELKRKLEQKKPAFVVSRVAYRSNTHAVASLKKDDSKLPSASNLPKIAPPKSVNAQNMSRLPRAPAPPRGNFSSVISKLPPSKPTCVSKALTTIPKPSFKPQTQTQQNKHLSKVNNPITTRSTQPRNGTKVPPPKFVPVPKAPPPSFKPTFLPNSVPGRKPAIARPAVKNSPVPKIAGKVLPTSQNNKPKSFAPANFLFKAPLNVKKIIFPNGVPDLSSKQQLTKGSQDSKGVITALPGKTGQDKKASQTPKKTFGFCKTPKKIQTPKNIEALKNSLEEKKDALISEKTDPEQKSPKPIETKSNPFLIPDVLKAMHSSSEDVSSKPSEDLSVDLSETVVEGKCAKNFVDEENSSKLISASLNIPDMSSDTKDEKGIASEETENSDGAVLDINRFAAFSGLKNNPFLIPVALKSMQFPVASKEECSQDDLSLKSSDSFAMKAELLQLPPVKFAEVDSVPTPLSVEEKENEPPQNKEAKDATSEKPDQDTLGNGKLHTIIEDFEICEEIASATKNRLKQMTQGSMTPRRSRRLASLHEKLMTGLDKVSMQGTPSKTSTSQNDLAEEMSLLNVNEKTTETEDKVPNLTPVIRKGRPSSRSAKKEITISEDPDSTPNRRMTRQQRKISLLGSPQALPIHLSRKSIRGDLMSFSPET